MAGKTFIVALVSLVSWIAFLHPTSVEARSQDKREKVLSITTPPFDDHRLESEIVEVCSKLLDPASNQQQQVCSNLKVLKGETLTVLGSELPGGDTGAFSARLINALVSHNGVLSKESREHSRVRFRNFNLDGVFLLDWSTVELPIEFDQVTFGWTKTTPANDAPSSSHDRDGSPPVYLGPEYRPNAVDVKRSQFKGGLRIARSTFANDLVLSDVSFGSYLEIACADPKDIQNATTSVRNDFRGDFVLRNIEVAGSIEICDTLFRGEVRLERVHTTSDLRFSRASFSLASGNNESDPGVYNNEPGEHELDGSRKALLKIIEGSIDGSLQIDSVSPNTVSPSVADPVSAFLPYYHSVYLDLVKVKKSLEINKAFFFGTLDIWRSEIGDVRINSSTFRKGMKFSYNTFGTMRTKQNNVRGMEFVGNLIKTVGELSGDNILATGFTELFDFYFIDNRVEGNLSIAPASIGKRNEAGSESVVRPVTVSGNKIGISLKILLPAVDCGMSESNEKVMCPQWKGIVDLTGTSVDQTLTLSFGATQPETTKGGNRFIVPVKSNVVCAKECPVVDLSLTKVGSLAWTSTNGSAMSWSGHDLHFSNWESPSPLDNERYDAGEVDDALMAWIAYYCDIRKGDIKNVDMGKGAHCNNSKKEPNAQMPSTDVLEFFSNYLRDQGSPQLSLKFLRYARVQKYTPVAKCNLSSITECGDVIHQTLTTVYFWPSLYGTSTFGPLLMFFTSFGGLALLIKRRKGDVTPRDNGGKITVNVEKDFSSLTYAWENCVPLSRTYQHDHFTFGKRARSATFWLNGGKLLSWWALSLIFATLVLY